MRRFTSPAVTFMSRALRSNGYASGARSWKKTAVLNVNSASTGDSGRVQHLVRAWAAGRPRRRSPGTPPPGRGPAARDRRAAPWPPARASRPRRRSNCTRSAPSSAPTGSTTPGPSRAPAWPRRTATRLEVGHVDQPGDLRLVGSGRRRPGCPGRGRPGSSPG